MKIKTYIYFTLSLFVGLIISSIAFSQSEADNYKMRFKFNTAKEIDNSRLLEVNFVAANNEDRKIIVGIYDAEIHFYNITPEKEIEIGTAKTDNEGTARLILPEGYPLITDEEGFINLRAVFEGSSEIKAQDKDVAVKDIYFKLDFENIDSVKTVFLHAYTLDSLKNNVPVEGVDVVFSVGAFLSKMPIEKGEIVEGEYSFEFPSDIRGDKNGNVKLFVLLKDDNDFGNVTYMQEIDWGIFDDIVQKEGNTLWSEAAPIWMYVVLSILLLGVWANFIYTIINIIAIYKEGKKIEKVNLEGNS